MSEDQPSDHDKAALDFLADLRDGLPEACDFCHQPFTKQRYPVPEEAGEWACSECEARWNKLERADKRN